MTTGQPFSFARPSMASSPAAPTPPKGNPDFSRILIDEIHKLTLQVKVSNDLLTEIKTLVEGFTSGGASFRSYQLNPVLLAYAAILGPVLGDRIDGNTEKDEQYEETMLKGAAVMAARLVQTLDQYSRERAPIDYLERICSDLQTPPEPTP
jgi:hypothetical protein